MESTFTKQEFNQQEKENKRQFSSNRKYIKKRNNYNNRNKQGYRNRWMFDRYPQEIVYAFNYNLENIKKFNKIITNFSKGRHILDLSALDIIGLDKQPATRRKALINICTLNVAAELGIMEMNTRDLCNLSTYVYTQIQEGLKLKIKDLELNIYLTPDRIINSGKVLKNHNGQKEYGGITIRDYITYYIKQEEKNELSQEEKNNINVGIEEFLTKLQDTGYATLKSVPFSIMRIENHIKIDENGIIISPDIEAKDNLRKIIKPEIYNKYGFSKLSATEATKYEIKLFKNIKSVVKEEIKRQLSPLVVMLPKERISEDIKQSIKLDNISMISKKGRIQDIVEYMHKNVETIANLENDKTQWNRRLNEEEIQSIFQIEYAAMPSSINMNDTWITDLSLALRCIYATYPMIKVLINHKFVPLIDDIPITRYTDDYITVDALIIEALKSDNPQEYFESKGKILFPLIEEDIDV